MKYDYNLTPDETETLRAMRGKRLVSYRLNDTDNTSFEIFVLRLEDVDIEVATKEIAGTGDWFDETNVVEVRRRPNRDSWSRIGESYPPNGIAPGTFMDYQVDEVITGVSVAVDTFARNREVGEYVRGIVIETKTRSFVFDKGELNWQEIWCVRECPLGMVDFATAEFDSEEQPGFRAKPRIERIC